MAIRFPSALDGIISDIAPKKEKKEVANTVANKSRHGKYADKEARRAYMRDYMRKRRELVKAKIE